jgi:uncharacterized membrane protein
MKNMKFLVKFHPLAGTLMAFNYAVAAWTINSLPHGARIATHWALDRTPDLFANKWLGMLFIPLLGTFLWSSLCSASKFAGDINDVSGSYPLRVGITVLVLAVQAIAEVGLACHALGIHA